MQILLNMALFAIMFIPAIKAMSKDIVVYSARKEHLIKPLFDSYEKKTGIKIKYVTDSAAPLLERLKGEGKRTMADILMTVDAGNLWNAANSGVLQSISSKTLSNNIPAYFRDPDNRWFGLSVRARTIAYSTERVKPSELKGYWDLGEAKWKGRLCLRTSKKVYNQSLVAMFIAEAGVAKTEALIKNMVGNLATKVFSNDTSLLKAINAGQCDVGIVNTYYFARLQRENPKVKVKLFFPKKAHGGVHQNVSGAGVTKYAPHKAEAIKFLEWLSSPEAQSMFADMNLEYPVTKGVQPNPLVKAWGEYEGNDMNVSRAGELQGEAIKLMDRAGYL